MLVSAFLAAAALAQAVGNETNYAHTALLFIEPETATLAVVDSADGSIADIQRQLLSDDDDTAVAQLTELVSAAESLETHPDAIFVVGSGIDIPMIKPALETATALPVTAAEEPDTALARGAALASANTPSSCRLRPRWPTHKIPVPARWTRTGSMPPTSTTSPTACKPARGRWLTAPSRTASSPTVRSPMTSPSASRSRCSRAS
ncbi:hypothetical protein NIIDMKKI_69780 [Mycobacterium kansasii]|uniref:DUF7159 domain-containing protein n=1 Tax=Mycobacterium kansasii TaxID=1768 RepID=A0A7G1INR4_MYCKA|nr:hypothetical protein NIIDMKKI_69780 [Mycobacterium kansasii]